jgi:hypothetical protein
MSFSLPNPDYGTDLTLNEIEPRGSWRAETGFKIDVQAKSTTRSQVGPTNLRYDLEVKAYDYLRETRAWCPRILVVLVLPGKEVEWTGQTEEALLLRRCAYWLSLRGCAPSRKKRTVRVLIPRTNVFSVEALHALVAAFKRGEEP